MSTMSYPIARPPISAPATNPATAAPCPASPGILLRAAIPAAMLAALATLAALYCCNPGLYRLVLHTDGVIPFAYPFIDAESIGRDIECWRKGIDVYVTNPCDVLGRLHNYSPLWLRATFLPTDPKWTPTLGLALDFAFIATVAATLRPRTRAELLPLALACLSPDVVFALERGNMDVALFTLLAIAALAAAGKLWARSIGYTLILLAGLLKFYPLAALALLGRERPRRAALFAGATAAILLLFTGVYYPELVAMSRNIPAGPPTGDLFGASNLPSGIEMAAAVVAPPLSTAPAILKLITAAYLLLAVLRSAWAWSHNTALRTALSRLGPRDETILLLGSALIAGCFFAGQNVGYRGIYLLFVLAGLLALRRDCATPAARRLLLPVIVTVPLLMWEAVFRTRLMDSPGFIVFLLIRELLWWYLLGFLLAVLGLSAARSPTLATLTRRRSAPANAPDPA